MSINLKQKINSFLQLPEEVVYDVPKITIIDKSLLIENYKNIVVYSKTILRINTSIGMLVIEGSNFSIKEITKDEILVNGILTNMEILPNK